MGEKLDASISRAAGEVAKLHDRIKLAQSVASDLRKVVERQRALAAVQLRSSLHRFQAQQQLNSLSDHNCSILKWQATMKSFRAKTLLAVLTLTKKLQDKAFTNTVISIQRAWRNYQRKQNKRRKRRRFKEKKRQVSAARLIQGQWRVWQVRHFSDLEQQFNSSEEKNRQKLLISAARYIQALWRVRKVRQFSDKKPQVSAARLIHAQWTSFKLHRARKCWQLSELEPSLNNGSIASATILAMSEQPGVQEWYLHDRLQNEPRRASRIRD